MCIGSLSNVPKFSTFINNWRGSIPFLIIITSNGAIYDRGDVYTYFQLLLAFFAYVNFRYIFIEIVLLS